MRRARGHNGRLRKGRVRGTKQAPLPKSLPPPPPPSPTKPPKPLYSSLAIWRYCMCGAGYLSGRDRPAEGTGEGRGRMCAHTRVLSECGAHVARSRFLTFEGVKGGGGNKRRKERQKKNGPRENTRERERENTTAAANPRFRWPDLENKTPDRPAAFINYYQFP